MQKSLKILQDAQLALNKLDAERAEENDDVLHPNDFRSRLLVADGGNGLHVQYDGEVWQDGEVCAFEIALKGICEAANDIVSLKFVGSDEGANGLRTHDFAAMLTTKASFPNLLELTIRPTDVADHNFVDVEANQLAALIARCPNLERLTLPHAPEPDFFNIKLHNLYYLRIGIGWQLYDFIGNLAKSSNFPSLTVLDFSDSLSVFQVGISNPPVTPTNFAESAGFFKSMGFDDAILADLQKIVDNAHAEVMGESRYDDNYTSLSAYQALFESTTLKKGAVFHLRNAYLTQADFLQLQNMRPDLQFSASLEAPHVYVQHWQGKFSKPFKHLII